MPWAPLRALESDNPAPLWPVLLASLLRINQARFQSTRFRPRRPKRNVGQSAARPARPAHSKELLLLYRFRGRPSRLWRAAARRRFGLSCLPLTFESNRLADSARGPKRNVGQSAARPAHSKELLLLHQILCVTTNKCFQIIYNL